VRLLAEAIKKAQMQGKVISTLKKIFTQPCSLAPKAYIVVSETIAQKKIQMQK